MKIKIVLSLYEGIFVSKCLADQFFSLFAQKNSAKHLPFGENPLAGFPFSLPVGRMRPIVCATALQTKKLTSLAQATHNKKRYLW